MRLIRAEIADYLKNKYFNLQGDTIKMNSKNPASTAEKSDEIRKVSIRTKLINIFRNSIDYRCKQS